MHERVDVGERVNVGVKSEEIDDKQIIKESNMRRGPHNQNTSSLVLPFLSFTSFS